MAALKGAAIFLQSVASFGVRIYSPGMDREQMKPVRAVAYGHLFVTLPVLVIIGSVAEGVSLLVGPASESNGTPLLNLFHEIRFPIGGFIGAAIAWIWWSIFIPRWRVWSRNRGADVEQTQRLAERTLLVWPKGSMLEKTEIDTRSR